MTYSFEEKWYVEKKTLAEGMYFLAGDIGGTNSNFGIMDRSNTEAPYLLFSLHVKSKHVDDYAKLVAQISQYVSDQYNIQIKKACFGVAGIINNHTKSVSPTNLSIKINADAIKDVAGLDELLFINDFEAVAVGAEYLPKESLAVINEGKPRQGENKAFLGAGTGLGKAGSLWHYGSQHYLPLASEGGHADFAPQTAFDLALMHFIQENRGNMYPVSWEEVLAGRGIQSLYQFLGSERSYTRTEVTDIIEKSEFAPDKISQYAQEDERSHDTFLLYVHYYARCAKNFALEMLSLNGMYIAGGIAAKNLELFKHPSFMDTFMQCGVHRDALEQVPVYVIADYNVSLYGAAGFMILYENNYI